MAGRFSFVRRWYDWRLTGPQTRAHSAAMQEPTQGKPTAWRSWRETISGLTMNEVARRARISSGRLSIIERGVVATPDEESRLRAVLIAASGPEETP